MRLRPLRIAVSVMSGLCCVLVIVLWVRSYWHRDIFTGERSVIGSYGGEFIIGELETATLPSERGWLHLDGSPDSAAIRNNYLETRVLGRNLLAGNHCVQTFSGPYWFGMLSTGLIAVYAAFPWLREFGWRFSLRMLLLATTAVALLLGLIIYATRG